MKLILTIILILNVITFISTTVNYHRSFVDPKVVVPVPPSSTSTLKQVSRQFAPIQQQPLRTIHQVKEPPIVQQQIVQQPIEQQPIIRRINEPINVPVISTHDLRLIPVAVDQPVQQTQLITVEPTSQAVHLLFKSISSPVSIQQQHLPGERSLYETTKSEEPPHVIRHEVFKPVVQELRETIQPYRQVTQEIRPVIEKINVLIPKQHLQQQTTNRQIIQQIQQQPEQSPITQQVIQQRDWVSSISSSIPKFPTSISSSISSSIPSSISSSIPSSIPIIGTIKPSTNEQQQQDFVQIRDSPLSSSSSLPLNPQQQQQYTVPIIIHHHEQNQIQQQRLLDDNNNNNNNNNDDDNFD